MEESTDLSRTAPAEIVNLASQLGSNFRITQGPGGNVSMKESGVLWVKASGTQMAMAKQKTIFVPVDLQDAQEKIRLGSVDFISLNPHSSLRPSIETAMHALIASPFVAHVHSLGSLSVSALKNITAAQVAKGVCEITVIPYVKPGIELAKCIQSSLVTESSALLLGNHGLTVWGNSPSECERLINELEIAWRDAIPKPTKEYDNEWIDILLGGVLFPDEIVFLGNESFSSNILAANIFELLTDTGLQKVKNTPWLVDFLKVLEEVARSGIKLEEMRYLTEIECTELLNWDAEKFRSSQVE